MNDLISRTQAIDALDGLCDRECEYSKKQRHVMCDACHLGSALDVIEQLPSAQPEKAQLSGEDATSDCVSRQAAIDEVVAWLKDRMTDGKNGKPLTERLKDLPPAQPERMKGKWVGYDGDWLKTMCKCSECGAMIDINEKYRNFFCYHCGADMREDIDAV